MWSYDHKRLYKNEDIQKLTKSENFNVVKLVGLTKYVVPFYYHIIRTIKLIIDLFPKSKVSESLNKFKPKKNILIFFKKILFIV